MKNDILNADIISSFLKNDAPVTFLAETDSTNLYLKKISDSLPEGAVVIADRQTAGRGRFKRVFHSPENCGIYMSILLRPEIHAKDAVLITAAAAVSVCEAIEKLCGEKTQIKWVNDILLDSKKVCGILAESVLNPKNGTIERAIVGIGINVYSPEKGFAPEIKDIAGFISEKNEGNLRNRLCAEITNRLVYYSKNITQKEFLAKYRSLSAVVGKKINVISNERKAPATALDIDESCRLLVEYDDKTREYLNSGEISIKL